MVTEKVQDNKEEKMKKKIYSVLLAMTMAVTLLTGCGSSKSEETEKAESTDEMVTLKFYVWNNEEGYIQKVIDEYKKTHENIDVELVIVPDENDSYNQKLQMLLSSHDESVDLVNLHGAAQVTNYANGEALLDLTEWISEGNLDVSSYGPMWETSSVNDSYYALPTRATCWVLYYNRDIFDQAGIAYPSEQLTWNEYVALCDEVYKTCKEKGITAADGTEVKGGMMVNWVMDYYSIQKGVYLNSDNIDAIKEGLQYNYDMYHHESCYSYPQVTATDFDYLSDFENGRVAMMPNGEWMVNMFKDDVESGKADIKWGASYMPVPEGVEEHTTFGDFQFAGISAYSKHPKESFDFLSYLCGEEGAKIYSGDGIIAAYSSDEVIDAYKKATGNDTVSVFFDSKKIQETPNDEGYEEIKKAFRENAEIYYLDEISLEECVSNFEKQQESILSR